MSLSRKVIAGGVVGVIVAIGLIVAAMYAFNGGHISNTTGISSTTGLSSTSISTTGVSSNTGNTGITTSGSTSTSTNSGSSGSTGTLQLSMIDPPNVPANVVQVYINYTSIQVHVANAGNQSGWYNVTSKGTIDLTKIVNSSAVLGSAKLPVGTYNIVRFNVTSAMVTINGTSGKLTNYTATVPSGMLQSVITGGVNVQANTTSGLLVDTSPKVTGSNGSYILVPSITAKPQTPLASPTTTQTQSQHTTVTVTTHTTVNTTSHTT
ncbi:MAG: DUF4382 domain-containing protein [Nitrososphaerota archaeon]|nr:DUF4382 domain-containing protein [Nitrososphaerota archaeon]MDG6922648.1 DUF4382 domain-containing protein [Nitrososphaerota archaeon]